MSIEEMKKEAINQIALLKEEGSLKEILDHLSNLSKQGELNLAKHYKEIKSKYGNVLEKLAK